MGFNLAEYRLTPVRSLISKKVLEESGSPESILKISNKFGMLSKEELTLLIKLKSGENVDFSNSETKQIIQSLLKKELIQANR